MLTIQTRHSENDKVQWKETHAGQLTKSILFHWFYACYFCFSFADVNIEFYYSFPLTLFRHCFFSFFKFSNVSLCYLHKISPVLFLFLIRHLELWPFFLGTAFPMSHRSCHSVFNLVLNRFKIPSLFLPWPTLHSVVKYLGCMNLCTFYHVRYRWYVTKSTVFKFLPSLDTENKQVLTHIRELK